MLIILSYFLIGGHVPRCSTLWCEVWEQDHVVDCSMMMLGEQGHLHTLLSGLCLNHKPAAINLHIAELQFSNS